MLTGNYEVMIKINLHFSSCFNTRSFIQNDYKKPLNLESQDCFIKSRSMPFIITNDQISFQGSENIDKFSSSFSPNKAYKKYCIDKTKKSPEPVKVGTVNIYDKKAKKPLSVDVCYHYSKIEDGEVYELFKNNQCLGKIAVCEEIDNSFSGILDKKYKTLQLFNFDNYTRDQFSHVGSELIGVGIRRGIELKCETVTLEAYNGSINPEIADNPIGFYFEKGFRAKPNSTYPINDRDVIKIVKKKLNGEINLQQEKNLLEKLNSMVMQLPKCNLNKWKKILFDLI